MQRQHRELLRDRRRRGDAGHTLEPLAERLRENRRLGQEVARSRLPDQHRRLAVEVERHLLSHPAPQAR